MFKFFKTVEAIIVLTLKYMCMQLSSKGTRRVTRLTYNWFPYSYFILPQPIIMKHTQFLLPHNTDQVLILKAEIISFWSLTLYIVICIIRVPLTHSLIFLFSVKCIFTHKRKP